LTKKILIGIVLLGIASIIGYFVFMANFELYARVPVSQIKEECDYDGMRKVGMYELTGNSVTNGTIYISVSDCDEILFEDSETVFSVSSSYISTKDINIKWKNFDTLTINYNKKLNVFMQKTESESVNPKITFEYIAD